MFSFWLMKKYTKEDILKLITNVFFYSVPVEMFELLTIDFWKYLST